jgi:hypothetical protein
MPRGVRTKKRQNVEQDSAVRGELRSVCKTNDSQRAGELLQRGTVSAADATACLVNTTQDLSLMRMLLEYGADPAHIASTKYMRRSFELVKLLVEFGYDISANRHCILQ